MVGSTIDSTSGGIVDQLGLSISTSNYNALGFSLSNTEIQPGSGILTQLSGLSGIPTGLTGIMMTSKDGLEFVNSTETNACQNECAVDVDDDGIYDDVDSCVGILDECGVCNGPGIPEGECDAGNIEDCTGICGGDTIEDCNGDCGGTAVIDCAGDCGGGGYITGSWMV